MGSFSITYYILIRYIISVLFCAYVFMSKFSLLFLYLSHAMLISKYIIS